MRALSLHIIFMTFLSSTFLFGQVQKDFREAEMLMTQLQANQAELFSRTLSQTCQAGSSN